MDQLTTAELERLELLLMDPAVRRDRGRLASLLADDFVEFGSSGQVWTHDSILELMNSEMYEAPTAEDFACRTLGEHAALLTYRTIRKTASGKYAVTRRSSVWTRESGNWKICFHQGTQASSA